MVNQIKWMQRKFEFNSPPGMMPNLLERMAGTPVRIEDMITTINDKILSAKLDNKWSVKEHIGHLTDIEELHEKRLQEILIGKTELTAADMSNKKTNEAGHSLRKAIDLLGDFKRTRNEFVKKLEALNEDQILLSAMHPRLNQPMRIIDIAFFTAEHDDQHLAIIRRILNSEGKL
jgi:hypothetical protein